MKKLMLIMLALLTLLAACTPYMYGVPQENWERMSEAERVAAIRSYEREKQERRRAEEERARREDFEREQERARQVVQERLQRERIEAIHRGEGAYGELIRVRLQGGRIKVGGRHYRYEPVTFTIADSETRIIPVADNKGREVNLVVTYAGGALTIENLRFPYDRSWGRGTLVTNTATTGAVELRGVDIYLEVRSRSSRFERELSRLLVIPEEPARIEDREQELPKPPLVLIRDREAQKPPPPVRPYAQPAAEHAPRTVEVVILGGELKLRGEKLRLERASLRLVDGDRRELALTAGDEKVTVTIHYHDGELIFAENFKGGRDAVRLPFEKEWKKGKVYRFAIKGRGMFLENIDVKVMGIEAR